MNLQTLDPQTSRAGALLNPSTYSISNPPLLSGDWNDILEYQAYLEKAKNDSRYQQVIAKQSSFKRTLDSQVRQRSLQKQQILQQQSIE